MHQQDENGLQSNVFLLLMIKYGFHEEHLK